MIFLLAWEYGFFFWGGPLVAQLVNNPPIMRETCIRSLSWKIPQRRERLPTPVFWPREFHGQYSPWCFEELDMTEQLSHSLSLHGFGGKKTAEVECPFNHVTRSTRLITGNADFYHLAEVVFVMLYHCQVTPFSPSPYCCIFWKEVTTCNSLFRNRELHSTSLKVELSMPTI